MGARVERYCLHRFSPVFACARLVYSRITGSRPGRTLAWVPTGLRTKYLRTVILLAGRSGQRDSRRATPSAEPCFYELRMPQSLAPTVTSEFAASAAIDAGAGQTAKSLRRRARSSAESSWARGASNSKRRFDFNPSLLDATGGACHQLSLFRPRRVHSSIRSGTRSIHDVILFPCQFGI